MTIAIDHREMKIIDGIVARAQAWLPDHATLKTDLISTHLRVPLRLQALLDASDDNFAHDILGIMRHFNRETLRLQDGFMPRFAQPNP